MLAWVQANWMAVLAAVYVVLNEAVALAPGLKSNSLVQLVLNVLKSVLPSTQPKV